jgi:Fic family protein
MTIEEAILKALQQHPDGLGRSALQKAVRRSKDAPWKFRRVLNVLEGKRLLHRKGTTRTSQYFLGPAPLDSLPSFPDQVPARRPNAPHVLSATSSPISGWMFSAEGDEVVALVTRPLHQRRPCSYERSLLDAYQANSTFYLRDQDLRRLRELGATPDANQPAGTWARHVFERLLIDLSWNSSRLEGNTYSLLDTERLFRDRAAAEGHQVLETQMLLNHKQAIEYLVDGAATLRLEPHALRTLHGMLAENLLPDPADEGQLRRATVRIHDSAFLPLDMPQQIEELFTQMLATAAAIVDPFEQSFFLLVHIPYLQPFTDVNKRTSRLAANLPLLRHNLQPLSFVDLPREAYTLATLGLYEQCRIEALRDVYLWAYQRSAERYRAIVQSLGEPDPFRLRYRDALRELVRTVVQQLPAPADLAAVIATLSEARAVSGDRPRFEALALQELQNLNEGTFHRYRLRPSEFKRWIDMHRPVRR